MNSRDTDLLDEERPVKPETGDNTVKNIWNPFK